MKSTAHLFSAAAVALAGLLAAGGCQDRPGPEAAPELAAVCVDELCGYVNSQGQWHIPPKFAAADPFSRDGLAWVTINPASVEAAAKAGDSRMAAIAASTEFPGYMGPNRLRKLSTPVLLQTAWASYDGMVGLIDVNGDFVVPPTIFWDGRPFSADGLAIAQKEAKGPYGFMDTKGQWVVEPQFEALGRFRKTGVADAKSKGLWGLINGRGQWVVEPQFDRIDNSLDDGLALVEKNSKSGLVSVDGSWTLEPVYDLLDARHGFGEGLLAANQNGKYGFVDASGQWVIEPRFDGSRGGFSGHGPAAVAIGGFGDGLGGKWGYIDTAGQWIMEPILDNAEPFSKNGLARVTQNGLWGVVNAKGQWVFEPKFDGLDEFSARGLAGVRLNGKYGFVNTEGRVVIEPILDRIRPFDDQSQVTIAAVGGQWGVLNTEGQWVIKPQFDSICASKPYSKAIYSCEFSDGDLAPASIGGQWGFINAEGAWVLEPQFDRVWAFDMNGLVEVLAGDHWGLFHTSGPEAGQWAVEPQLDSIGDFHNRGSGRAEINGQCGIMNTAGQWLIKPEFEEVVLYSPDKGLLSAQTGQGQWGLINMKSQWAIAPVYDSWLRVSESGRLAETYLRAPWLSGDGKYVVCHVDVNSGAYRTGLDENVAETGFQWRLLDDGRRELFNRQGQKILTVERPCGSTVVKNQAGQDIWPRPDRAAVCPERAERPN